MLSIGVGISGNGSEVVCLVVVVVDWLKGRDRRRRTEVRICVPLLVMGKRSSSQFPPGIRW